MSIDSNCDREDLTPLLRRALREPFAYGPVDAWFRALMECAPLWSFQAWAFAKLQDASLPTNYPMQRMIERICADEGLAFGERLVLKGLDAALDHRRYALADSGRYGPPAKVIYRASPPPEAYERHPFSKRESTFNRIRPTRVGDDYDSYRDPSHLGPDAEIGKRYRELITARDDAPPGSGERKKAQADFDRFQRETGAKQSRGRPSRLTKPQLKEFIDQSRRFLEPAWGLIPAMPFVASGETLADQGVTDRDEQQFWVARLVLPVLSSAELQALLQEAERARTWNRSTSRPTARLFAIWLLVHRLGQSATTVAKATLGSKASDYYQGKTNPIASFLTS